MKHYQQGAVLIVSLVLLLILTIVGISGMKMTSLEERMSGNYKDNEMAFQAAEAALVEAENFLENTNLTTADFYTDPACSSTNCFKSDCTGGSVNSTNGGLCFTGEFTVSSEPVNSCELDNSKPWEDMTRWTTAAQVANATTLTGLAADARFIIEFRCFTVRDDSNSTADPSILAQWALLFRITALANGGTTDSRVMLQSTYKKLDF
jgi:type IV pilus assembly protein PilX